MSEKLDELVATLAVHCQRVEDRIEVTEDIFSNSVVLPESKLNAILITMVLIVFFFCATLSFIWWIDRPI